MNGPDERNDAPPAGGAPELDAAYARASRADGTRPSLSTRASILANARREAAERATQLADAAGPVGADRGASRNPRFEATPAANDSSWNWRAAAGFIGIGLAGVMALWLYHGNPAPQPAAIAPVASSEPTLSQSLTLPPPQIRPESAARAEAQSSLRKAATGRATDTAAAPGVAGAVAGSQPTAAAFSADNAVRAAPPPAPPVAPAAEALLERWFPQALDRDSGGQQYWFALDRNGAVLGSGQRAWRDLPALQGALLAEVAPRRIVRIESVQVVNRRGRSVEVAYAWAETD